jgi:hypothetical protein
LLSQKFRVFCWVGTRSIILIQCGNHGSSKSTITDNCLNCAIQYQYGRLSCSKVLTSLTIYGVNVGVVICTSWAKVHWDGKHFFLLHIPRVSNHLHPNTNWRHHSLCFEIKQRSRHKTLNSVTVSP